MQNKNGIPEGSHRVSYLTPSKRPPALLTRVTKPEKVQVEKLSPLFVSSPGGTPIALKLTDVCQSVLEKVPSHEIHQMSAYDTTVPRFYKSTSTKATKLETNSPSSPKVTKEPAQTHEIQFKSQRLLNHIESQVISSKQLLGDDVDSDVVLSESGIDEGMDQMSSKTVLLPKQQLRHPFVSDLQPSHPPSVCSSCSGEDSLAGLSRSSFCDGCSSVGSLHASNVHSTGSIFPFTNVGEDSCNVCTFHGNSQENLNKWAEDLFESHIPGHKFDGPVWPTHEHSDKDTESYQHSRKNCIKKLSLNNEQLIFLILRLILSKYKTLMLNVDQEQRTSRSQRLTIACLIQAVVVLARRCHSANDQWHKMQADLRLIHVKNEQLRKNQRKVYVIVCVLVLINVLNLSPVRQRLLSCFRFFGIVETIKKINRTRRMIANNWRNIPLLLTDFWRIFIFRSNIRRNM